MIKTELVYILTAYLSLLKNAAPFLVFLRIFVGGTGPAFFKDIFENILSLTGVESGFFADSANAYQDLSFELLTLNLCANVVFGRK